MINGNNLDQLGERRAAILLGLTTMELRQLSTLSGLGHLERRAAAASRWCTPTTNCAAWACWRLKRSTNSLRKDFFPAPPLSQPPPLGFHSPETPGVFSLSIWAVCKIASD